MHGELDEQASRTAEIGAGAVSPDSEPSSTRRKFLQAAGVLGASGAMGLGLAACGGGGGGTSSAATTAPVAGGASSLAGKRRKVIWALAALDPWNIPVDVGFIEATKLLGWEYQKVGVPISQYSPENVVNVITRATTARPDVLVTPAWVPGVADAAKAAQDKGILVIFNNANNIPAASAQLGIAYVGANEYADGQQLGPVLYKAMTNHGRHDGTVIAGIAFPGNENLEQRMSGVKDSIDALNRKNGTSFKWARLIDNSGKGAGPARTAYAAKIRQTGLPNVAGMLTLASDMNGPVGALREAGAKPGQVPVVTFDIGQSQISAIQDGWVTGTVDKQDYTTGFTPVMMAWQYFVRGQAPQNYASGGHVVTKAGIDAIANREKTIQANAKAYHVKLS